MVRKSTGLANIFDDEPAESLAPTMPHAAPAGEDKARLAARKSSHPGKKPVLIHIPEDMHRALRQLSVEDGGEPLTKITERALRQYLVQRGHTKYAP